MNSVWMPRVLLALALLGASCGEGDEVGERRGPAPDSTPAPATAPVTRGSVTPAAAPSTSAPADQRYAVAATVLEQGGGGPQLCFEVMASLPPMCSGPKVIGLDWADVSNAETVQDPTWATVRLVGRWDPATPSFTLTEPPTPSAPGGPVPAPREALFPLPCPTPPDGWPSTADNAGFNELAGWLSTHPDVSASWMASPEGSTPGPGVPQVLVVRVTDGADRAGIEQGAAERYQGPVCIVQGGPPRTALNTVVGEVRAVIDPAGRGVLLSMSPDEINGRVTAEVVLATPEMQAALDERFGRGTIVLVSRLVPVDGEG